VVAGFPTRNEVSTVRHVVDVVEEGLCRAGWAGCSALVNADNGSSDGTPAAFGVGLGRIRRLMIATGAEGTGKGSNVLAIFRAALDMPPAAKTSSISVPRTACSSTPSARRPCASPSWPNRTARSWCSSTGSSSCPRRWPTWTCPWCTWPTPTTSRGEPTTFRRVNRLLLAHADAVLISSLSCARPAPRPHLVPGTRCLEVPAITKDIPLGHYPCGGPARVLVSTGGGSLGADPGFRAATDTALACVLGVLAEQVTRGRVGKVTVVLGADARLAGTWRHPHRGSEQASNAAALAHLPGIFPAREWRDTAALRQALRRALSYARREPRVIGRRGNDSAAAFAAGLVSSARARHSVTTA